MIFSIRYMFARKQLQKYGVLTRSKITNRDQVNTLSLKSLDQLITDSSVKDDRPTVSTNSPNYSCQKCIEIKFASDQVIGKTAFNKLSDRASKCYMSMV